MKGGSKLKVDRDVCKPRKSVKRALRVTRKGMSAPSPQSAGTTPPPRGANIKGC